MSLQFVLGGSGWGKSTYVFDKVIERSMVEENTNFLILVPDQFTMQTQMDLVTRHPRGGIMNIDVLSFSRLSYRILEETGGGKETVLDDTGKSLVLRKVAEELKEEIPVLGSHLKKLGYIHEVKSAISEFMQYGIGSEEMKKMLQVSEKRGGLYGKLKDLNTLYMGFTKYIQDKYITTEETYDRLANQLEKSSLIRKSVVILDGFTGFTPIQNRVIEKLLMLSKEVIVTLSMDKEEVQKKENIEQQLFSMSRKTMNKLEKIARDIDVDIKETVWMEPKETRFKDCLALAHLEKNLFRYPYKKMEGEIEGIHILEADTIEEEVKNTCYQIRNLINDGYSYREIAIILGDLGAYGSILEEKLQEYEIPVFWDQTRGITLNPFIEYIRSAIQVLVKQYSYETMFHYLRSGMVSLDRDSVDKLENYCLAYGIKGKKAWTNLFCRGIKKKEYPDKNELTQEEMDELNALREKITGDFDVFKPGKQKVKKQIEQLYSFLTANDCYLKLKKYEEYFVSIGDRSKEKEYAQIYRLVMELLEQMNALLGEEVLSWEEFGQILDAGFGEIQVGTIPQAVDQIVVGDMERTRLKQVKVLFVLGVNDGKIPKLSSSGGIISDIDREYLAEADFELAPTPRQQMFIQKFYLYLNVTKPSHELFLSYARRNGEGKSLKPSYFIESIRKLFPKLLIEKALQGKDLLPKTKEEGRYLTVHLLEKYKLGETTKEEERQLWALWKVLQEYSEGKEWVEDILDSVFYTYTDARISKEAARALYGTMLQSSVSRLEKMASCAYAHFLQYGLNLQEREEYSFQAIDMGNVFHGVLEMFSAKLTEENHTWFTFEEEEGLRILKEVLDTYAVNYGNTILFANARNGYVLQKIERILWRTVKTLQYQLKKGKFLPKKYELSFSALEDLDAVTIRLNEEEKLHLRGRIDRVDTYEDEENVFVKVVDYKSGEQQFRLAALYHGLQLQLVIYLNAAMELQQKQRPDKQIVPGAFVYYHVADPLVEGREEMSEEEIEAEIKKQLRVSGIVNSEPKVLENLESSQEGKSDVIPIEYKKDGSLSSRSNVMTTEQIGLLQKYAVWKAAELGRDIANGDISMQPCSFRNKEACTFCRFKDICAFDSRLEGFHKRQLEDEDEVEIWKKIRKTVEDKEES